MPNRPTAASVRIRPGALVPCLVASALRIFGVLAPAPLAAATPAGADLTEVARKDTLVVSGFGPGLSEITDPQNMNPYSLGGLSSADRHAEP